jgi:hypothetical protein
MDPDGEECRIYIVRKPDQREWMAKVKAGDEVANVCLWAASNINQSISKEPIYCVCCEKLFSSRDMPQAFIVLIPIKRDPDYAHAHAMGVCGECSKQDDGWLIERGPKRGRLSPTGPRHTNKIH